MILIKFVRKGVHYSWLVNDNWVVIFVFALTLLGGIIIKIFRSKKKKLFRQFYHLPAAQLW